MAELGVDAQVLADALETSDVLPVDASYAKRRKVLQLAGMYLYASVSNSNFLSDC